MRGKIIQEFFYTEDDGYCITTEEGNIWITGEASGEFTAEWFTDPGRLYMRNGDPGYPPSSDVEISLNSSQVTVTGYYNDKTQEEITDKSTVSALLTKEQYTQFSEYMADKLWEVAENAELSDWGIDSWSK